MPEIQKAIPILPENVRIIPPESDLSSYTLAECSKASLTYGSKVGLEIAARGIPVIVCGESLVRGKGFTRDVQTKKEFVELLSGIHEIPPLEPELVERAIRYGHFLFLRKMIDFPFVTMDSPQHSTGIQLALQSLEDLLPGKTEQLDVILDGILDLKPLHMPQLYPA
jgi:hypothetical protein